MRHIVYALAMALSLNGCVQTGGGFEIVDQVDEKEYSIIEESVSGEDPQPLTPVPSQTPSPAEHSNPELLPPSTNKSPMSSGVRVQRSATLETAQQVEAIPPRANSLPGGHNCVNNSDVVVCIGTGRFANPAPLPKELKPFTLVYVAGLVRGSVERAVTSTQPLDTEIPVGAVMRVVLDASSDANIVAQTGPAIPIDFEFNPTPKWTWVVTPQRSGVIRLTGSVEVLRSEADPIPIKRDQIELTFKAEADGRLAAERWIEQLTGVALPLKAMLEGWTGVLSALAILIAAAFGVWKAIKQRGRRVRRRTSNQTKKI